MQVIIKKNIIIIYFEGKIESKTALIDQQPFKMDIQNIKEELTKLNEKFEKKMFRIIISKIL